MKNLVIDLGNSLIKVGIFVSFKQIQTLTFKNEVELAPILTSPHDNIIASSVRGDTTPILEKSKAALKINLKPNTALPINIKYSTPQTLGVDRIADACGAIQLFPNQDTLVIDLGTCINYEFVDRNHNYLGGLISPGVNMRFKSMNTFTAQLPLVEAIGNAKLIGDSTASCLQSGVMNGVLEEMNGIISKMKINYPQLRVILTGGDYRFFENQMKDSIFAAPELVLTGLNRILIHNVSK